MKWRELPEEDRGWVLDEMRETAEGRRHAMEVFSKPGACGLSDERRPDVLEVSRRDVAAHESAIAALEELARGPETPPSR